MAQKFPRRKYPFETFIAPIISQLSFATSKNFCVQGPALNGNRMRVPNKEAL